MAGVERHLLERIAVEPGQLVPLQNMDTVGFGRLDLTYMTPGGFYRYLTEHR